MCTPSPPIARAVYVAALFCALQLALTPEEFFRVNCRSVGMQGADGNKAKKELILDLFENLDTITMGLSYGCASVTCVSGMSSACSGASANFVAGSHQDTVGTVTAEVREGAHRRRVITKDDV